jgi:LysM repeat protein
MKPTLLFTSLALVLASPALHAKSELEALRTLCKEQERQIHLLEEKNAQLRGIESAPRKASSAPAKAEAIGASSSTYTVKAGDSFTRIARKVGTTPESLAKVNGLKTSSVIQPGQKLKLPASSSSHASASAESAAVASPTRSGAATHKVVQGETFYSIAKKHGIPTDKLVAANPTIKPSTLRPGQVVSLIGGASSPTTTIANTTKSSSTRSSSAPASRASAQVPNNIPVSTPSPKQAVAEAPTAPAPEGKIQAITIDTEMTYGDFASNHGTDTSRLNALNGLDLTSATVLAKGSELYVPGRR